MIVTLDASVWLAALSASERDYERSAALVTRVVESRVPMHQPVLFIIEVCATIGRRTRDPAIAMAAGETAVSTPGMHFLPLDPSLASEAADVAATCALRGADAVYVATARRSGATLVTLDLEVRDRAAAVIDVRSPSEWLQAHA